MNAPLPTHPLLAVGDRSLLDLTTWTYPGVSVNKPTTSPAILGVLVSVSDALREAVAAHDAKVSEALSLQGTGETIATDYADALGALRAAAASGAAKAAAESADLVRGALIANAREKHAAALEAVTAAEIAAAEAEAAFRLTGSLDGLALQGHGVEPGEVPHLLGNRMPRHYGREHAFGETGKAASILRNAVIPATYLDALEATGPTALLAKHKAAKEDRRGKPGDVKTVGLVGLA